MAYISVWCIVVWGNKSDTVPLSQAPSAHPSTSAFFSLGTICVPDQAPFFVWVEPVLPFTFVSELVRECLVVYIPQMHTVTPHLKDGFCSTSQEFWCDQS
jgi:hypothetical protein